MTYRSISDLTTTVDLSSFDFRWVFIVHFTCRDGGYATLMTVVSLLVPFYTGVDIGVRGFSFEGVIYPDPSSGDRWFPIIRLRRGNEGRDRGVFKVGKPADHKVNFSRRFPKPITHRMGGMRQPANGVTEVPRGRWGVISRGVSRLTHHISPHLVGDQTLHGVGVVPRVYQDATMAGW